jgi:hypothetical protein
MNITATPESHPTPGSPRLATRAVLGGGVSTARLILGDPEFAANVAILGDPEFAADVAYLHSLGYALMQHATPEHLHAIFDKWPSCIFDKWPFSCGDSFWGTSEDAA